MDRTQWIAVFRIAIGIAQMTMALVTLGLYLNTGGNVWSYGSLAVTILLVVGSRISFLR
jgi:hypothetical protein